MMECERNRVLGEGHAGFIVLFLRAMLDEGMNC